MKKHKFTLVEILGVVGLIIILLVISVGVYTYAMDSSKEKATKATIVRVHNGLQLLQDKGFMKVTKDGSSVKYMTVKVDVDNKKLQFYKIDDDRKIDDDSKIDVDSKGYKLFIQAVDGESLMSILDDSKLICDAWGQQIFIRFPGKFNKGGIDIISAGGDGVFGDSDSGTVPPENISNYKDSDGDLTCDDISNFF